MSSPTDTTEIPTQPRLSQTPPPSSVPTPQLPPPFRLHRANAMTPAEAEQFVRRTRSTDTTYGTQSTLSSPAEEVSLPAVRSQPE